MQDTRKRDLTIRLQPEDGCASLKAPPVPPLALHTFKTEAMSRGGTLNASRHQPLAGILAPLADSMTASLRAPCGESLLKTTPWGPQDLLGSAGRMHPHPNICPRQGL